MSEEYEEVEEEVVEELTAEEIFEQHQAEIDEMFEEKNFFQRLKLMFSGLKQPKTSREYKIARTELQRLKAPLIAILLPVVGVIVLIVITAVQGKKHEIMQVEVSTVEDKVEDLTPEEDPPDDPIDMTQDVDVNVEVTAEVAPAMVSPAPPSPSPGGEPDKVAAAPSPVTMSAVSGTVKMRGLGDGNGGGFGTLIGGGKGGGQNVEGCLIGVIIDFKNNPDGTPNPAYNCGNYYYDCIRTLLEGDFGPEAIGKYFCPPKKVALNHLFIQAQPAGNGPRAFGVDDVIKPSGFVAYYTGKIKATETARYRFVGYFDDIMIVRLNKKVVLEDNWGHKGMGHKTIATGWASSDPENGTWPSFQGMASPLTVGDWFDVEPGKEFLIEVLVGERPGGAIGGILLIQKEGVTYDMRKTDTTKRPVLPIFASRPLSYKEKDALRAYSESHDFKLSVDSPRFNSRRSTKTLEKATKNDVQVKVDI